MRAFIVSLMPTISWYSLKAASAAFCFALEGFAFCFLFDMDFLLYRACRLSDNRRRDFSCGNVRQRCCAEAARLRALRCQSRGNEPGDQFLRMGSPFRA